MFEINMHSIIDSKVFGVKIGENLVVERFYDYKHAIE
jgi:hypothetical protein